MEANFDNSRFENHPFLFPAESMLARSVSAIRGQDICNYLLNMDRGEEPILREEDARLRGVVPINIGWRRYAKLGVGLCVIAIATIWKLTRDCSTFDCVDWRDDDRYCDPRGVVASARENCVDDRVQEERDQYRKSGSSASIFTSTFWTACRQKYPIDRACLDGRDLCRRDLDACERDTQSMNGYIAICTWMIVGIVAASLVKKLVEIVHVKNEKERIARDITDNRLVRIRKKIRDCRSYASSSEAPSSVVAEQLRVVADFFKIKIAPWKSKKRRVYFVK